MLNKNIINVTRTELPPLKDYVKYLKKIWAVRWITNNGELVQELEKKLEKYLKVKHIVLVSSGTLALQLAFKALDLSGEVITTPFTFAATTNALISEGITPVFADIDADTYTINPEDVEEKITKKSCAILAVHVYGNPCDLEKLQRVADKYNLKLIYDAAHAFGVEYRKESILRYGDISILSFHATKIFSTAEGGAIIVKDDKLYEKLKLLRNFGIKSEEEVVLAGINAKMNELQAALGLCNLKDINHKIRRSQKLYERYFALLGNNPHLKFQKIISSRHNYCYVPVCFKDQKTRDFIYKKLIKKNIKPRKYFYPLITDFDYVRKICGKVVFENASDITKRVLCLPIYPSLGISRVSTVAKIINTTT